jgi:site-specific recombinase XerC
MLDEMEFSVPEAAAILRDLLVDRRYREYPVGRTIARYIEYMRSEWGATERTLEDYSNILDKLALEYPDMELAEFDGRAGGTEILREFISGRWGHVSPSTRGKVISTLKSFFRWCLECDLIEVDPTAKLRRPRRRGAERHAHDPREIHALIRAQPRLRERVAISLMARLGLRKNELRMLRWADIDFVQGEVRIHGKGGKVVDVPIPYDDLRADLAELVLEQNASRSTTCSTQFTSATCAPAAATSEASSARTARSQCSPRRCIAGGSAASRSPGRRTSRCTSSGTRLARSSSRDRRI